MHTPRSRVVATLLVSAALLPAQDYSKEGAAAKRQYEDARKTALQNLTALVELTERGKQDVREQWAEQCEAPLGKLLVLKEQKLLPASEQKWYQEQHQGWLNAQSIGQEMMDLHHEIAVTLVEIEQDIKDSEAWFQAIKSPAGRVNSACVKVDEAVAAINECTTLAESVAEAAPLFEAIDVLDAHAHTFAALLRKFRERKFEFIDEHDLKGRYRTDLDKLRSKKVDPDETGELYVAEREWEETMYDTYQRYLLAVDKWRQAHRLVEPGQGHDIAVRWLNKAVQLGTESLLGVPLPGVTSADPDKLGEWCLLVKRIGGRVIDEATNNAWKHFRDETDAIEEAEADVHDEYNRTVAELEETARERAGEARSEWIEKEELLETGIEAAIDDMQAARDNPDLQRRHRAIIEKLSTELRDTRRKTEKQISYWEREWLPKQESIAFTKRERKLEELRRRRREVDEQKPK